MKSVFELAVVPIVNPFKDQSKKLQYPPISGVTTQYRTPPPLPADHSQDPSQVKCPHCHTDLPLELKQRKTFIDAVISGPEATNQAMMKVPDPLYCHNSFEIQIRFAYRGSLTRTKNQSLTSAQTQNAQKLPQPEINLDTIGPKPRFSRAEKGKGIEHIGPSKDAKKSFRKPGIKVLKFKRVWRPKYLTRINPSLTGKNSITIFRPGSFERAKRN